MGRIAGLVGVAALAALLGIGPAQAAAAAPVAAAGLPKVSLMVGGVDKIIYLPAKLAEDLGYFKAAGLDVEILSEPAGVEAVDELLADQVQGVVGFYDHTIDLQAHNKTIESVVQLSQAPGEVELCATRLGNRIKSPADWAGHNLGVTGLGASTNFLTDYLAVRNGVPVGHFTAVAVEAGNSFIAAMQQGRIDCGMTTEPTVSRVLKMGLGRILIDLRTPAATRQALGGTYPAAALYMQSGWVDAHPEIVQKLADAFVRTLIYIDSHSAEDIAAHMPRDYAVGDPAAYVQAIADGKAMFTADGMMPKDGPPTVLKVLSSFNPAVRNASIDLSRTYTTRFVEQAKAALK